MIFILKNIFSIIFVIIGTLIGAGFASGKEMYLFFGIYDTNGIYGIIISAFLISLIIFCVFNFIRKYNIEHYEDFLNFLCGTNKNSNGFHISMFLNSIINLFLLISFYVMIAGFSAFFVQEFNIPSIIGSIIICFLCYFTFTKNVNGVIKANSFLIPILIFFIFIFGFKNIGKSGIHCVNSEFNKPIYNWFISAILYGSYNSIILIPVLITLKNYLKDKKSIFLICVICMIIFILLALVIFSLISIIDVNINNLELPTVYAASLFGSIYSLIYGFILLISIFTSAVSCGYGLLQNCTNNKKSYNLLNLFICTSSVFVSNIGFSNLVNVLYPFFGFLGLVQIVLILWRFLYK